MSERSYLTNGRFFHRLDGWQVSGATYSAGDGDDHFGLVVLATGGKYVEQTFAVQHPRAYTFHVSVKPVGGALSAGQATLRISDGDGNVVTTQDLSGGADVWTENSFAIGLAEGTTYTLRLTNVSAAGDVRVDDVWAWWVPMTRAGLATRVHEKLGRLATERALSTTTSGALTEGDYTHAVDAGLRSSGAVNPETDEPDVRWLEAGSLETILEAIEQEMLERLQRDYAVETDISLGSRSESRSQIRDAISELTSSAGGGSKRPVQRKMRHDRGDFEL
jgi:hypothetical protein